MAPRFDVTVIGAGPAGSTVALLLARSGFHVCVIEKRPFPREMLCGEFLSHEVVTHLDHAGLRERFLALSPHRIRAVRLSVDRSLTAETDIPFDAYGLRRAAFDSMLLDAARDSGAAVLQPARADDVTRGPEGFAVRVSHGNTSSTILSSNVIGAYGKRSRLDGQLERRFAGKRSALVGVKFHIAAEALPRADRSVIHLFARRWGYCGLNAVDNGMLTACWLERGGGEPVPPRQRLREILAETDLADGRDTALTDAIEAAAWHGAGNIYLGTRERVIRGVFMAGDAAGMIAPLSGDGIGMAIESAVLLCRVLIRQRAEGFGETRARAMYDDAWTRSFAARRAAAALAHEALLRPAGRALAVRMMKTFPGLLPRFVDSTRRRRERGGPAV